LRTSLRLRARCASSSVCDDLRRVLTPDNEGVPKGLRFSMVGSPEVLEFDIESDSPLTAVSTSLALLRDMSLFQKIWLLARAKDA